MAQLFCQGKTRTVKGTEFRAGPLPLVLWPHALGKWEFAEATMSVCQATAVEDVRGWHAKRSARWSLDPDKEAEHTWNRGENRPKGRS